MKPTLQRFQVDGHAQEEVWDTTNAIQREGVGTAAGIFKVCGREAFPGDEHPAFLDEQRGVLIHPDHWHRTEEAALARVKKMIAARRAELASKRTALDMLAQVLKSNGLQGAGYRRW